VAGRFGCWRDQIDAVFKAEIGRDLSPAENMAILRRQSEAKAERDLARQRKAELQPAPLRQSGGMQSPQARIIPI
jgi:hypothetical protein